MKRIFRKISRFINNNKNKNKASNDDPEVDFPEEASGFIETPSGASTSRTSLKKYAISQVVDDRYLVLAKLEAVLIREHGKDNFKIRAKLGKWVIEAPAQLTEVCSNYRST